MGEGGQGFEDRFRPLRPASRPRLIAAFVLGPIAWAVALAVASWLIERTDAIEIGLLVTVVAFVVHLHRGTAQLVVALGLRYHYDRWGLRSLLVGAVYPLAFWLVSATAALHQQVGALIRGPRERRVVWDITREQIDAG